MKLNKTNLSHWSVSMKIFIAIRQAVKTGIAQYVYNRKGEPFIRVNYKRGTIGALTFWDKWQNNCTELVLSVIREVV